MRLPESVNERVLKLIEQWSARTGKHPKEDFAEYTRFIVASCLTMRLPMREQIALEMQMAEQLAREYGVDCRG